MERNNQHYSTIFPDTKIKINTISVSLRRYLYLFKTVPGVFSYKKLDLGTKILIENMTIPKSKSIVLDLGCGYGPIGIVLSNEIPESVVYFIDINKRAIWCTKENIRLNLSNKGKKTFVIHGNFFNPISRRNLKFDGIYMNPPLRQGKKVFLMICAQVPHYLKPNGFFEFVIRKKMGADTVFKQLSEDFSEEKIEIKCKRSGYWCIKSQKK